MNSPIFNLGFPEIPAALRPNYESWEAGFDAATQSERTGEPAICPFFGKQAATWRSGFEASRRVTELTREL
jgi:hypothetical protein